MSQATNAQTCSLTDALALHGIGLTAAAANKVLHSAGMIENRWRESSKPGRPPKQYCAATALGEQHGIVNEAATVPTGDPILVRFVPSRLAALWSHPDVQATLAIMVAGGEVTMKSATAKRSEVS